jgi:8-oxo-dGTP diphosphatase
MKLVNVADLIIINSKNQILLAKRMHEGKLCWSIPGGKCEGDETFEKALAREIKEELNSRITELGYFKSYYLEKSAEKHYRVLYFYGKIKGKIKLNDELLEYKWFDIGKKEISKIRFFLNQKEVITEFIKFFSLNKKKL